MLLLRLKNQHDSDGNLPLISVQYLISINQDTARKSIYTAL